MKTAKNKSGLYTQTYMVQLVGAQAPAPKVGGLIPSQGTNPNYEFNPQWGCLQEAND